MCVMWAGEVSYVKRQHYFTIWMDANEREGIVKNIAPNPPFSAVQTGEHQTG